MVNLFDEDSGFIDLPELPMPGAKVDSETGVVDFDLGAAPPLTQEQKIEAFGPSGRDIITRNVISNMSNLYNFLAPSDDQLARLRAIQAENQKIADQTGMPLIELYRMFGYGDPRGDILEDMGFTRPTLGMNLIQGREFLFGAQKQGYNKLKEGADFLDLTGEEQFGIVLSPLDLLDIGGLSFGLKKLAQAGLKKLGPKATLADAAKDKQIMKLMSDGEAKDIIEKLKPVIDGEQEFLLRGAKGPKQKKSVAPTVKDPEVVPGIKIKGFDESLIKTKPLKEVKTKDELPAPPIREEISGDTPIGQPRDIIKDVEEEDIFLAPAKPLQEEVAIKSTPVAKDPVVVELKTKIPKFASLSNAEKQVVAQKFSQVVFNPAKKKELFESLTDVQIMQIEDFAKSKGLIVSAGKQPLRTFRTKVMRNDPKFENDATVDLFAEIYEKEFSVLDRAGASRDARFIEKLGKENYNKLKKLIAKKGVKIRETGPGGAILKPDGMEYLRKNNKNKTAEEMLEELRSNKDKYFYTDRLGDREDFATLQAFKNYKGKFGFTGSKRSELPPKPGRKNYHQAVETFQKKIAEIEKIGKAEITPELLADEFRLAVQKAEGMDPNVRLPENERLAFNSKLLNRINDYNKTLDVSSPYFVLNNKELNALKSGRAIGEKGRTHYENIFDKQLRASEQYQEALSLFPRTEGDVNPLARFLNFIRESTPEYSADVRKFDEFIDNMTPRLKDLQDSNSIFSKNFEYFKTVDNARVEMNELTKPFLNQLFKTPAFIKKDGRKIIFDKELFDPTSQPRRSLQIAHRYMHSQIGDSVPKGLAGASEFPQSYTVDVSVINQSVQPQLERMARDAVAAGDEIAMREIHENAERFGTAFEVDGIPFGTQKGIADKLEEYLRFVLLQPERQKEFGITKEMILNVRKAIDIARSKNAKGYNFSYGGMVEKEDIDIFQDDLPEGSFEVASLKLPFFKLFGKAPVNEVAPIPTPKDKLTNPSKKQTQSLETEKAKRAEEDIFDPTPGEPVTPESQVAMTPLTNQPMTSVFYSDIERALVNAPDEFPNKQAVLDFMNKNRIKKSEVEDYRIPSLLKLYDDGVPITKQDILSQIRTAPISGMKVHGTGKGSDIINPNGDVATRYTGYAESGSIDGTQRERILYLNRDKLPGDTGEYPQSMFGGENIQRHGFGIPNEDNTYVIGWTRLTDRFGFVPPKVAGPKTKINVRQLTREKTKNERSLQGLYAEAKNKIGRLANQRGMSAADQNDILLDFGGDTPKMSVIAKYADQLEEVSPGLVNQMDELVVRNNELQEQITKSTAVDPSGVVRVTFADEIQSDLLQAAAMRKQQLAAALRKIQEEGAGETNLQGLNRLAEETINFYEKNKSVFRPLKKTDAEIKVSADRIAKLDEEVDTIVNKYIQTREVSDADLSRLSGLLNENLDNMLKEIIEIDSSAMDGLFPDLPFKNRDEWADALIKKDLYELAYRKFVLKDPDASSYYAVSPSKYVIERYKFKGDASTPVADRAADKQKRFEAFKNNGEFKESKFKGIGMDEFYGGPDSVSNVIDNSGTKATNPNFGKPKHYTSTIETILKKQAQSNNSEMITMPVQLKGGEGSAYFKITDQNDNMVATLTNGDQARELLITNPNYKVETITVPNKASMEPVFAIKITPEMLEPYKTHKAQGGLVEHIDIFEV